jgi:hypothetical protein
MRSLSQYSLLSVLIVTGLLLTGGAIAQAPDDPQGFTTAVASLLKVDGISDAIRIVGPLTLEVPLASGGKIQINLDRTYGACRADPSKCGVLVNNLVKGAEDVVRQAHTQGPATIATPESLRAVLRPESYIRENPAVAQLGIMIKVQGLPEGLQALLFADQTMTMRLLGRQEIGQMHMSADAASAVALRNMASVLGPTDQAIGGVPPQRIGVLEGHPYESSRMLLHDDWAQVSARFGGHLIIAVPSAEQLIYGAGTSPEVVRTMSAMAHEAFARGERGISPSVFAWQPKGWTVAAP